VIVVTDIEAVSGNIIKKGEDVEVVEYITEEGNYGYKVTSKSNMCIIVFSLRAYF